MSLDREFPSLPPVTYLCLVIVVIVIIVIVIIVIVIIVIVTIVKYSYTNKRRCVIAGVLWPG